MPQDSLRSVVYRSFVTCDDPKGVVESKTIRKSKQKIKKAKEEKQSNEELQNLSCFQMMEVSRGAERLNEVIGSLSNRPSIDASSNVIATDLLRGALDLQESLVMLGKLQEASNYIANSTKKHKEKSLVGGRVDGVSEFRDDYEAINFEKPRISSDKRSMDCYDELREVIRESFARQNLLSAKEKNCDLDRKNLDLCVDLPSSSSSHSSLICSHSSGCSPSPSSIRHEKMKGPNLIAKLMGLEEVPSKAGNGGVFKQMERERERIPYRSSPLLDIDLPRLKKPQFMVQKVVREKRTLEEIIETMQFKGILGKHCVDGSNDCRYKSNASRLRKNLADGPPIVLMRPLRGRGECDGETHDDSWSRQMQRKMKGEFPPRAKLKTKESNEKLTPKQKLDVEKNTGRVGVRPAKKTVDSQDRQCLSTTKMKQSKPLVPQLQKKEAVVKKIDKIPKVAANTRKLPETKDAKPKPQRSDKTQDLAKLATLKHGRTVRENNVSKSQIARGKVAATDRNMKPTSLNPTVPKKNPRKSESKSKASSALVGNIQSDANSEVTIETNIEGSLVKNTEAEQSTEEVSKASNMSDAEDSGNAATSLSTKDDLSHIEEVHCIQSYDSDQIKGCKSITNTRHFLLSSASFLNHVEELFDIGTHDFTDFQTPRLSDGEALHDSLLLDCAKEILERKSVQYRRMRKSWPQSLLRRPKCHFSMEQLVEEICGGIEDLQSYGGSCGDVVLADSIYPMLERDLWWNEEVTGGWDSGWRNGYTTEAVDDEVMHDVEELVLSEIVGDVIIEIM